MAIVIVSSVTLAALLLALFLIVRRIMSTRGPLPLNPQWIAELSVERYRPMMRLLDHGDLVFLRAQPGFTPRMAAKFRMERCQVFRGYLAGLETDFQRVCTAVRLLMLQAQHDRPDLASVLLRHQAAFALGVAMVHVRLFCYRYGLCGVDVSGLVRTFEAMRLELRSLAPAAATAGF